MTEISQRNGSQSEWGGELDGGNGWSQGPTARLASVQIHWINPPARRCVDGKEQRGRLGGPSGARGMATVSRERRASTAGVLHRPAPARGRGSGETGTKEQLSNGSHAALHPLGGCARGRDGEPSNRSRASRADGALAGRHQQHPKKVLRPSSQAAAAALPRISGFRPVPNDDSRGSRAAAPPRLSGHIGQLANF